MIVKKRPEIVSLKAEEFIQPGTEGVVYLEPHEWRRVMESGEDYVMIDVRNDYESRIGHFDGALLPPVKNFYDFPQWLDEAGIRKGPQGTHVLHRRHPLCKILGVHEKTGVSGCKSAPWGYHQLRLQEGGAHFRGKCFVFDDRWWFR